MLNIFTRPKKKIDQLNDQQLVEGCLKQKPDYQEALYNRYARKMLGVCIRYAPDEDEASDYLQDAFIRMFEKLNQFRFDGSFEGWLRRLVTHTCIEKLRHRQTLNNTFNFDGIDITEVENHSTSVEFSPDSQLHHDDLCQALESLPLGYRTVFNLYAIEGYSHPEIANLLGISEGTSKSQLSHARKALQKTLIHLNSSHSENSLKENINLKTTF